MIKLFKLKILTRKDYIKKYNSAKEKLEELDFALRQCTSKQPENRQVNLDYYNYQKSGKASRKKLKDLMSDKYYLYK